MIAVVLGCAWGMVVALPIVGRAMSGPARRRAGGLGHVGHTRRRSVRGRGGFGADRLPRAAGVVGRVVVGLATRGRRRAARAAVERAVPLTLDVVTMALRAGGAPRHALAVAAPWCPVDVAGELGAVERRCRLGATFPDSLAALAVAAPPLAVGRGADALGA